MMSPNGPQAPMHQQPVQPQVGMPGAAMAASILWLIYGALGLLGGLSIIAAGGAAYFQIIFGLAFLITGIQVLMGRASSILFSGITCIILGALSLLGALFVFSTIGAFAALIPGWVVTVVFLNSALLIVAGILACVGNSAFLTWRVARGLAPPSPYVRPPQSYGPQAYSPQQSAYQSAPQTVVCPTCRNPMRFVQEMGVWRCDSCSPGHPAARGPAGPS